MRLLRIVTFAKCLQQFLTIVLMNICTFEQERLMGILKRIRSSVVHLKNGCQTEKEAQLSSSNLYFKILSENRGGLEDMQSSICLHVKVIIHIHYNFFTEGKAAESCSAGDPAIAYGSPVRKPITNTTSSQSMKVASTWVQDCCSQHECSNLSLGSQHVQSPQQAGNTSFSNQKAR